MGARAEKDSCVRGSAYALGDFTNDLYFIRRYLHLREALYPKARGVYAGRYSLAGGRALRSKDKVAGPDMARAKRADAPTRSQRRRLSLGARHPGGQETQTGSKGPASATPGRG